MYRSTEKRPTLRNLGKNLLGIPEIAAGIAGSATMVGAAAGSAFGLSELGLSLERSLGAWSTTPLALTYFVVETPVFVACSLGALAMIVGVIDGLKRTLKAVPELVDDTIHNVGIKRQVARRTRS